MMNRLIWTLELVGKFYFAVSFALIAAVGIGPFLLYALLVKIIDNLKYIRNEIETMRNGDHQHSE